MKAIHILPAALAAFALSLAPAIAAEAPLKKSDGVMVDRAGKTVYTFDKDAQNSGKSACNAQCASAWPPVPVGAEKLEAPYSSVTREDGTKQLAYQGKPLYFFANDAKPGDRNGDGVKEVWHVVKD